MEFSREDRMILNMDGNTIHGNRESGLNFEISRCPTLFKGQAKNHYYFLPLILGIIGMFFHFKSQKTDAISVLLFFFI